MGSILASEINTLSNSLVSKAARLNVSAGGIGVGIGGRVTAANTNVLIDGYNNINSVASNPLGTLSHVNPGDTISNSTVTALQTGVNTLIRTQDWVYMHQADWTAYGSNNTAITNWFDPVYDYPWTLVAVNASGGCMTGCDCNNNFYLIKTLPSTVYQLEITLAATANYPTAAQVWLGVNGSVPSCNGGVVSINAPFHRTGLSNDFYCESVLDSNGQPTNTSAYGKNLLGYTVSSVSGISSFAVFVTNISDYPGWPTNYHMVGARYRVSQI